MGERVLGSSRNMNEARMKARLPNINEVVHHRLTNEGHIPSTAKILVYVHVQKPTAHLCDLVLIYQCPPPVKYI